MNKSMENPNIKKLKNNRPCSALAKIYEASNIYNEKY